MGLCFCLPWLTVLIPLALMEPLDWHQSPELGEAGGAQSANDLLDLFAGLEKNALLVAQRCFFFCIVSRLQGQVRRDTGLGVLGHRFAFPLSSGAISF